MYVRTPPPSTPPCVIVKPRLRVLREGSNAVPSWQVRSARIVLCLICEKIPEGGRGIATRGLLHCAPSA